ncbi:hypothetical protein J4E91_010395 [Alternaria rosae]|nr:hypothetical protein J4E91_010395 [Alternaria rosae]
MAPQAAGDVVAAGCLVVLSFAFDEEEEKEPIAEEASVLESIVFFGCAPQKLEKDDEEDYPDAGAGEHGF